MFCLKCGEKVNTDDLFCPKCGEKIEKKKISKEKSIKNNKKEKKDFIQNAHLNSIKKIINQNNFIALIACILLIISYFLPFASIKANILNHSESINIEKYVNNIIILILSIISLIFILLKKDKFSLISGVIIIGLFLVKTIHIHSAHSALNFSYEKGDMFSLVLGSGYYLTLIGALLLIASVIIKEFIKK